MGENLLSFSEVLLFGRELEDIRVKVTGKPGEKTSGKHPRPDRGNNFLGSRLGDDPKLARIYGFSFEGTYYELPAPTLFLVDGDGDLVSEKAKDPAAAGDDPSHRSRAPRSPEYGGLASSEFQFADDIRVWSYDKSDYTIRMDVASGMIEQVLLEPTFASVDASVSGAKVSGAKVSGAKVSGAKVSGAKVSGAKARGPND